MRRRYRFHNPRSRLLSRRLHLFHFTGTHSHIEAPYQTQNESPGNTVWGRTEIQTHPDRVERPPQIYDKPNN